MSCSFSFAGLNVGLMPEQLCSGPNLTDRRCWAASMKNRIWVKDLWLQGIMVDVPSLVNHFMSGQVQFLKESRESENDCPLFSFRIKPYNSDKV
jgi:hypothetical protein